MSEGRCAHCGESVELADLETEAFEASGGEIFCALCAGEFFDTASDETLERGEP